MADPQKTRARFAILGDDPDPEEITALMGWAPDRVCCKGDATGHRPGGVPRIARTGKSALHANPASLGDLNAQISAIVAPLPTDPDLWAVLAARFRVNVFCGVFMGASNEGRILSPEVLLACGMRELLIDLDVRAPTVEDDRAIGV